MTENKYTGSVPLDLLSQGSDARLEAPKTARDPIWFVPRGEKMTLQFVSGPRDFGPAGWFTYREAQASGILLPGSWAAGPYAGTPRGELPYGMREIPVEDIELVEVNGEMKYRYRRPYLEVTPGNLMNIVDDIIDARSQRFTDDNGRTKVEWMVLVNVIVWAWPDLAKKDGSPRVKPEVGTQILLKLTKNQASLIVERLVEKMDEDPNLDVLDYKWDVTIIGGKPNKLVLRRGEKITEPVKVEPYDAQEIITVRRNRFEEHVKAAFADYMGLTAPDPVPDFAAAATSDDTDPVGQSEATDLFEMLSTPALRTRLKKAGVEIPSGSSREKLVELAVANLEV